MGATGGAGWSGVSEGGAWQPQTHCQEAATLQELSPHPPISPAGAAALSGPQRLLTLQLGRAVEIEHRRQSGGLDGGRRSSDRLAARQTRIGAEVPLFWALAQPWGAPARVCSQHLPTYLPDRKRI